MKTFRCIANQGDDDDSIVKHKLATTAVRDSQSVQPNTEEIEGPSHSDIGIATEEVLNEEDLLEIQEEPEEVPRSEPDIDAAGCRGWTEGPETPAAEAGVDIGIFIKGEVSTREEVEEAVRRGSKRLPLQFPNDSSNWVFPNTILCYKLPNGEDVHRDWLVWSEHYFAFLVGSLPRLPI
eukprot:Em0048g9a